MKTFAATPWQFVIASIALNSLAVHARAGQVEVAFDTARVVECHEVTPEQFAALHPNEKVVEANFRVSVRIVEGDLEDIEELQFELTSPKHRLRVLDFAPQTRLESDVAGEIQVTETNETQKSFGVAIGGGVAVPYGPIKADISPSANLGTSKRNGVTEVAKKIPPKTPVVVSGTTNQEHGVFYKFKASPQSSLEGMTELSCRFIVPKAWHGDWVELECRAEGRGNPLIFQSTVEVGRRIQRIALYPAGDAQTRRVAQRWAYGPGVTTASAKGPPKKCRHKQQPHVLRSKTAREMFSWLGLTPK